MTEQFWEVLVPCVRNNGRPISTRCHREFDRQLRRITGGLTVMPPVRGQWVSPSGELFVERMIPVRVVATEPQIEAVADLAARYYDQQAILYYRVSDYVRIKHYA